MRSNHRIVAMLMLVNAAAGGTAAEELPTLERLLAIPYPTRIATAEAADRVAFVLNERGARNVWTASPEEPEPRRLTPYAEDDGQPLGGLTVTPDGSLVVYTRGGGKNPAGERPNPSSDPAGVTQSLWVIPTAGGEAWSLGEGAGPVIAPSGRSVVFRRDDGLYLASLDAPAAEEAVTPELLFSARGRSRRPVFSPDGERLAFVSDRGDHSFIGVYHLTEKTLSWLAPSVDRDDFPVWSPDSRRLAFVRRDGALKDEVFNFLVSWPFRIMVTGMSGAAREVHRSTERGGGFAQIYPAEPLRWAGDRLVFYSEDDGFMHIYSVPLDGGAPTDLTPGRCEAEHSDVDPSGEWLVFSHNCDAIDLRQVGIVAIAGGDRRQLAPSGGIHTAPAFADGGQRVYLRSSDSLQPTAVARVDANGDGYRRILAPAWPEGLDAAGLVEPTAVVLTAADAQQVHAQLFEPQGESDRSRPALVFMHGGPMRQMLLGWHYMEYYSRCYAFNQYMASRGWVVLSVNFRSGIGYGQDFRLAPRQGPYGASEYQDIVAAGRFLQSLEAVDGNRVALWGGSYGGYLTALGLARDSDLFAAGVDLHGVHDWSLRATDFNEGGGWGIVGDEAMQVALESSPAFDVSAWRSPVLMVHGDDDRNVLFQQTTDLVVRLRRHGLEPEILVLPDEVHGFLRQQSWLQVFTAAAEFLQRQLGGDGE